jgi:predicted nuclease of restriction endonuclease-like (RecB) superfamily
MPEHNDQSLSSEEYNALLVDVSRWLEQARKQAGRAVNALMTTTYWRIGERVFEQEQRGGQRVGCGERIVEQLARDLSARFGRGVFSCQRVQMRQFYLTYRAKVQTVSGLLGAGGIVQTLSGQFDAPFPLSWSHYVRLLTVTDNAARDYYEHEALRGGWSVRDLDRQIATKAYQRLRGKPGNPVASSSPGGLNPEEHIRDPFVLEFLDLKDEYSESDLEQALILELGNDFAFVARQKRLRIGTEWYRSICYFSTGDFDPC